VQVNSCRPEHKDAPADGGRNPKAAAISQTEYSQYPERQVGYGGLVLKGIPRRPANRRRNWTGSHRVPDKTDQSAQPYRERKEVEQQHICNSLRRPLLSDRNVKET
jgi:hypothetical protein